MPRKKSVGGRSRRVTDVSRLMLEAEKIEKRFRQLEKAGLYGTYKSRELLRFVAENPNVEVVRSKRSKRHRLKIKKAKLNKQEVMLIDKKFKSFLKSLTSTPLGIKITDKKIREKIEKTLQENYGGELTKDDIEIFYDILRYKSDEIVQQIPPSEFFNLVVTAREERWKQKDWLKTLTNYADINNKQMQNKARKLYNKLVKK